MATVLAKEPAGSAISKNAVTTESISNIQSDSGRSEIHCRQFTEQV